MKKIALLLASAILVSGTAMATEQVPIWLSDFRKADLNDSGGLSKAELEKSKSLQLRTIRDNFSAIDLDHDGHVTQSEYEHFLSQDHEKIAAKFKQMDLNDSGGLSRKELDKLSGKEFDVLKMNFDAIDADKDGQITFAEYQTYQKKSGSTAQSASTTPTDQCKPNCGIVIHVDRYKVEGDSGMLGTVAGGVAGGVLGNQTVGGTLGTVGGAAGGAYVGHQLEKRMKTKKMVKVTVKLDNGQQQDFNFEAEKSPFAKGARVQVMDGHLTHYTSQ